MQLPDWLWPFRSRESLPASRDPLQETIDHAHAVLPDALATINESRHRRGAPPLCWEDLLDPRQRDGETS